MEKAHKFITPCPDDPLIYPVFLQLEAKNIVYLKFFIDSYEELASLRTLTKEDGIVLLIATKDTIEDLLSLLEDLHSQTQHIFIEKDISSYKELIN